MRCNDRMITIKRDYKRSDVEPGIMPQEFGNSPGRVLAVRELVQA
jgi:hypothetical protein